MSHCRSILDPAIPAAAGSGDADSLRHALGCHWCGKTGRVGLFGVVGFGILGFTCPRCKGSTHIDWLSAHARSGDTALSLAAGRGHLDCMAVLIEAGVSVDATDRSSNSALIAAARYGQGECMSLLLNKRASVHFRGRRGDTVLIVASRWGQTEGARMLIESSAAVDAPDNAGDGALHWAARNGHSSCLLALLEGGASVDLLGQAGNTALISASENGRIECVALLLKVKASIEIQSSCGDTALIAAAKCGADEVVTALIDVHACVDVRNLAGDDAFVVAARNGHAETEASLYESVEVRTLRLTLHVSLPGSDGSVITSVTAFNGEVLAEVHGNVTWPLALAKVLFSRELLGQRFELLLPNGRMLSDQHDDVHLKDLISSATSECLLSDML